MERNRTKFKYILGVWKNLPGYPTPDDIIYELNVYLLKDGRPDGEFSRQTFNSIYGPDWETTDHGSAIEMMFKEGFFTESEKSSENKKWYKIKNNTYYS